MTTADAAQPYWRPTFSIYSLMLATAVFAGLFASYRSVGGFLTGFILLWLIGYMATRAAPTKIRLITVAVTAILVGICAFNVAVWGVRVPGIRGLVSLGLNGGVAYGGRWLLSDELKFPIGLCYRLQGEGSSFRFTGMYAEFAAAAFWPGLLAVQIPALFFAWHGRAQPKRPAKSETPVKPA